VVREQQFGQRLRGARTPDAAGPGAKELRLRGISTIDAANAYAPASIVSYNVRFAKPPKSAFDVHQLP